MRRHTGGWRLRRASPARPSSRGALRVAAVAVTVVAAGVTAGSAAAVGQQVVSLSLGYSCSFPSQTRLVTARLTATFPTSASTGQQVKPAGTAITVTLPPAALARLHAATVTMTAELATQITDGPASVASMWRDFRSPATALPPGGPAKLTASGTAPAVTLGAPGHTTVAAGALSLLLRPVSITASGQASSTPMAPASVQASCLPRAGQDTTLATIAVTGRATAKRHTAAAGTPVYCPHFPNHLKLNPMFPLPKPPPDSRATEDVEDGCSYAAGFTDAARLHEAVLVGPGLTDLRLGVKTYAHFPTKTAKYTYIQVRAAGQLEYDGQPELPPARGTLLAFGFMPVSATLQISEIGSLNAALISCAPARKCPNKPPSVALFYGLVSLHISDVDINGVPLNVGPHCQTAAPFDLELVGLPPSYNVSAVFGVLTGVVTIPDFTGCANGPDDLDPIFNATVSGPGNFAKITQAPLCFEHETGQPGCPPAKPVPVH
jgi:hypothetical protein